MIWIYINKNLVYQYSDYNSVSNQILIPLTVLKLVKKKLKLMKLFKFI